MFASLHNTLLALQGAGYTVDVPADPEALRALVVGGNAEQFGTDANVAVRIPVDNHVRRQRWLPEIEAVWGAAPGRQLTDGASLFILGRHFGNVFVGLQPAFGYEGDPRRLLFERGFAPTHAFNAFYRYISEEFAAHAVLHFGTHGALEFMPGKQAGLSAACWPDRLIGGTGALATEAARRGASVVATDLSPTLVNLARERAWAGLAIDFRVGDMADPALGEFDHVVGMDSLIHYRPRTWRVVAGLAARTRRSLLFTFAPRTPLLSAMHAAGRLFPRGDRAPSIEPVRPATIRHLLEAALPGHALGHSERVADGFYISQALEVVRA